MNFISTEYLFKINLIQIVLIVEKKYRIWLKIYWSLILIACQLNNKKISIIASYSNNNYYYY